MGLVSPELSLDLRPSYVPDLINGFLREISIISDVTQRLEKVDEFVRDLEEEMKKIEVFKRELPLCMLLLKDAIQVLKENSTQYRTVNAHSPVLEEFIPLKETGGENNQISDNNHNNEADREDSNRDKKDWMSSVQLWNANNIPTSTTHNCNQNQNQTLVSESQKGVDKRNKFVGDEVYDPNQNRGGSNKGFVPMINSYPNFPEIRRKLDKEDVGVRGLSLLIPEIKHPKQDTISSGLNSKLGFSRISSSASPASNGHSNIQFIPHVHKQAPARKQRRCWSPELHRRFVDALTQLGGPQVATPKQIRELMRVNGLTNDEVKSHLQKYRLHARRDPNNSATSTNENPNGLACSWGPQDQHSDSSKPSSLPSGSPEGPLQFPGLTGGTTSTTGGDSMEDDDKSEGYSWKGYEQKPGKDDVYEI